MDITTVTGTITGPQTITLDQPLEQAEGRVRVTIYTVTTPDPDRPRIGGPEYEAWKEAMRARRKAEGRRQKTHEEIQEIIREARGE